MTQKLVLSKKEFYKIALTQSLAKKKVLFNIPYMSRILKFKLDEKMKTIAFTLKFLNYETTPKSR